MNNEEKLQTIRVQVSAPVYWGYSMDFEVEHLNQLTPEQVIQEVKRCMASFFRQNNLLELAEGVQRLELHVHQSIRGLAPGSTIYVCSHH